VAHAVTGDRGRDVSAELVEVRTVLSRAENALTTLRRLKANETTHDTPRKGHWEFDDDWATHTPGPGQYVVESYAADPDIDAMIDALERTVDELKWWRRTSRAKKS
jgi:hypothetical protein